MLSIVSNGNEIKLARGNGMCIYLYIYAYIHIHNYIHGYVCVPADVKHFRYQAAVKRIADYVVSIKVSEV